MTEPATPPRNADESEPELQYSPLQQVVERDGVRVRICIYRGEGDPGWLLEVEDHLGGSTVWDDPFETDQAALDEAMRAIDEDGIESFANAQTEPSTRRGLFRLAAELPPISDILHTLDDSPEMIGFHAVCGMFAAVASAPQMMRPSEWLDVIKGEHVFESMSEVQAFTSGVMALYDSVLRSVAEQDAHCCPAPDDHKAISQFCEGYLGIALRDDVWEKDTRAYVKLLPMLALAGASPMEKIGKVLPEAADDPEAWLKRAREELSETVKDLYDYWAQSRRSMAESLAQRAVPIRGMAKVGRNAPCPCGSGKKFKKCCAH